jgi:hypothetical protein
MLTRKSINVLPENVLSENRWKEFQPVILQNLNKEKTIGDGQTRGLLKLVLGVVYFLSLVAALTILLT